MNSFHNSLTNVCPNPHPYDRWRDDREGGGGQLVLERPRETEMNRTYPQWKGGNEPAYFRPNVGFFQKSHLAIVF